MSRVATITSFDAAGAGNVVNQVAYQYNGYGLVSVVSQEHDGTVNASTPEVRYHYDDGATAGQARYVRLSSVEYPGGREVFYLYPASGIGDALNRVEAIADDGGLGGGLPTVTLAEYRYLGASTIVAVDHPSVTGGLTLDYNATGNYEGWDRFGRVVNQEWTDALGVDLDRYTYTYDFNSNRTTRGNALNSALSESYTYDALDLLVDVDRNGSDYQSWNLDSLGNWDSFDDQGSTETRDHNAANELTGIDGGINPTFDAAGNMTSGPKPDSPADRQHYQYDAWNRLVAAYPDNGSGDPDIANPTAQFEYDGRNYRVQKTAGGILQAFFYNEGHQELEVRENGDVNPSEQYVWDLRYIDAPVVRFHDANADGTLDDALYYANDANMNVTALIDAQTGNVVERYHYDPYGQVQVFDVVWTPQAASAFDNVYLFTGRRLDAETALFYYRARYFDGSLGRFIGRDPIGYNAGTNTYQYTASSPFNYLDPLGLAPRMTRPFRGRPPLPDVVTVKQSPFITHTGPNHLVTYEKSARLRFLVGGDNYKINYNHDGSYFDPTGGAPESWVDITFSYQIGCDRKGLQAEHGDIVITSKDASGPDWWPGPGIPRIFGTDSIYGAKYSQRWTGGACPKGTKGEVKKWVIDFHVTFTTTIGIGWILYNEEFEAVYDTRGDSRFFITQVCCCAAKTSTSTSGSP